MLTTAAAPVNEHFFPTLGVCVFTSFSLLVAATAMNQPAWVATALGVGPLVYYHLLYLTPRARKGLSHTAIDSVYYFGFLVTIAALGVSAVSLAVSDGKAPLHNVAFQFGLGLLATGYAVLARMHLTSVAVTVDEADPEAVLDRYILRTRELIDNVEMASTQFANLANNLMLKSQEVADTAQRTTEQAMLNLTRTFDEEMRKTLAASHDGLRQLHGLVSDVSFVQEREQLIRSVKETLDKVNQLNGALGDFTTRATEGARTTALVTVASNRLGAELTGMAQNVERIGGKQGQMVQAAEAFTEAHQTVSESTRLLGVVVSDLKETAADGAESSKALKTIRSMATKAHEQVSTLVETAKGLDEAATHLTNTAQVTNSFAAGLDRAAKAAPAMADGAEALENRFTSLTAAAEDLERQMQSMPKPTEDAVKLALELKESLQAVQAVLAHAGVEAKTLAGNTEENAKALEVLNKLGTSTALLQSTSDEVTALLQRVGTAVGHLQQSLAASTETLKDSLGRTTDALDKDVTRASGAAHMFIERLTDSAQIIIDRTRGARV